MKDGHDFCPNPNISAEWVSDFDFVRRQDKWSREKWDSIKSSKIQNGPWVLVNSHINDKSNSYGLHLLDPPTTYPHNIERSQRPLFYHPMMQVMMLL